MKASDGVGETPSVAKPRRNVRRILSIDGGGIRGLIPALFLAEIDRRLEKSGKGRPLASVFDLIAGTSTGALIGLGLALPESLPASGGLRDGLSQKPALSLGDIVDFYVRRGQEIFPPIAGGRIRATVHAFRYKYDGAGLERVLSETFGDATLKDGLTNLLITSFDTKELQPLCMKNRPWRFAWQDDLDFNMRDAARASTAAPTFFPPALVEPVPTNGKKYCLVDGSMFASNPSLHAYIEATKLFPDADEYQILSLGTGEQAEGFPYEEISNWGFFEWINPMKRLPLFSIMAAGQSESVNHMLRRITGARYLRVTTRLEGCSHEMDDASPANIQALRDIAERLIETNRELIESFVDEI
ncbi:MAG TPA: patatin-like phospholipase family protein [Rectinemataceae bacterium]|nr:patatin-like phospholipase family protein [Rectinemataceae bacterium]